VSAPGPTACALLAILLWASLAAVAGGSLARVPALTLLALALACAAATLLAIERARGRSPLAALRPPAPGAALLGLAGIGGYHACLFLSFERAAALGGTLLVEANLLNYLWPLLIVLLSAPILGERLGPREVAAALTGLAGTALTVTQGRGLDLSGTHISVHALAALAALIWAAYSCALRRSSEKSALAFSCAAGAALAAAGALARGDRLRLEPEEAAAAAYLGVLPLGAAFALWERAVRTGPIQRIVSPLTLRISDVGPSDHDPQQ
jgi:drug/metabolite transporter (DMT)-like permease